MQACTSNTVLCLLLVAPQGQMSAADKLQEDTNEAKNALEAYIYDLRNKLYENLGPFVQQVRGIA